MDLDPDIDLDRVARSMLAAPLPRALGVRLVRIERASARFEVPWREDLVGDPDEEALAGGVTTALIDHTLAAAVRTVRKGGGPTLDMRVDFVRLPARRASVTCEGRCHTVVGAIAFTRAIVWDADCEDPFALAQAVFALPETSRR